MNLFFFLILVILCMQSLSSSSKQERNNIEREKINKEIIMGCVNLVMCEDLKFQHNNNRKKNK